MTVETPSISTLREISDWYGLELSDEDLRFHAETMRIVLDSYERLDALEEPKLPVSYARGKVYRPGLDENELGAWYYRCDIEGASDGPLAGRTVAVKDTVSVADVPLMNGTSLLEGFVPDVDATVVTRILDAGGIIAGKSVCEALSFSDGSHTADTGPVLNPHDHSRSAGGSSSGSAALVVNGDVDMALGGDQAGSIRMPAAFCGCYGLKPTYGLVPYSGIFSSDRTLDHIGPMTRTVTDAARMLGAIAGADGIDPRQLNTQVGDYEATLEDGVEGMRIGLLSEGFGWPNSEPDVDEAVRTTGNQLSEEGATVTEVSVPMHAEGVHIWTGIAIGGGMAQIIRGNAGGPGFKGYYDTPLIDAFAAGMADRAAALPVTVKIATLVGEYAQTRYGGRYYAKARNLARTLTAAYDEALADHDILVMPTTRMKAPPRPAPDADQVEVLQRAFEVYEQTCAFDVTGHPVITIPCALSDGLPVGMMAIGRHHDDAGVLRYARACEQSFAIPVGVPG